MLRVLQLPVLGETSGGVPCPVVTSQGGERAACECGVLPTGLYPTRGAHTVEAPIGLWPEVAGAVPGIEACSSTVLSLCDGIQKLELQRDALGASRPDNAPKSAVSHEGPKATG